MKKFSIFQITLLAVFGALAVSGVLIFAFAVGGGSKAALGPVTIWGTLPSGAFTTVLRQAADADSQLNQVTYVQKDPSTYQADLTQALASGKGPDLFLITQDYAIQDAGEIVPTPFKSFSQSQFESTFADVADSFIGTTGIEAVPIAADPLVLYWNKDMLSSAGYSQPPAYWDEISPMAQQLSTKDDAGSLIKSAIDFGEYQNVDNAKDVLATLILQAGGPITFYDNAGKLESDLVPKTGGTDVQQSTLNALRFFTQFADPSKDYYSWNRSLPDAQAAFAAGDLALYVGYASEEVQIERINPNLNFAATALPQIRGGARSLDTARVYALAAAKSGKNPSSALTVAYVLNEPTNAAALSTALGLPSPRRDLLGQTASGDPDLFNKMVIIGHSWADPDPEGTDTIFQAMIEDTTSGAVLISQAVSRADQQLSHLISQQQ